MARLEVGIRKLREDAEIPTYGTDGAAALDVKVLSYKDQNGAWEHNWKDDPDKNVTIYPGQAIVFGTGMAFNLPFGYYFEINARSGMAFKRRLRLTNCTGILDSDYTGELHVMVHNDGNLPRIIQYKEKLCQIILKKRIEFEWRPDTEAKTSERGDGGFGHTGK